MCVCVYVCVCVSACVCVFVCVCDFQVVKFVRVNVGEWFCVWFSYGEICKGKCNCMCGFQVVKFARENVDECFCMGGTFQVTARFQDSDFFNKNGFEMHFECDFSSFNWSYPRLCVCGQMWVNVFVCAVFSLCVWFLGGDLSQ